MIQCKTRHGMAQILCRGYINVDGETRTTNHQLAARIRQVVRVRTKVLRDNEPFASLSFCRRRGSHGAKMLAGFKIHGCLPCDLKPLKRCDIRYGSVG